MEREIAEARLREKGQFFRYDDIFCLHIEDIKIEMLPQALSIIL